MLRLILGREWLGRVSVKLQPALAKNCDLKINYEVVVQYHDCNPEQSEKGFSRPFNPSVSESRVREEVLKCLNSAKPT